MITGERELEQYLHRTAQQVDWSRSSPDGDVARGRGALRRRRAGVAGISVAACALVTGSAVMLGLGTDTSMTRREELPPAGDTSPAPVTSRAPGSVLPENADAESVVIRVLDPQGRHASYSSSHSAGEYGDDQALDVIRPRIAWLAPGMERPGTVEVTVARAGTQDGWQCSSSCGSYVLHGRQVLTGVTDGGLPAWRHVQADGDVVQVMLHDFPDGVRLPRNRLDALLASPELVVPDVPLPGAVLVHRTIDAVGAGVVVNGYWNYRLPRAVDTERFLDVVMMEGDRDRGRARWEVVEPTDDLGTCPPGLRDCRLESASGTRVRTGVLVGGDRAGWRVVEADHGTVRVRALAEPLGGSGEWAMPPDLSRSYVLDSGWARLG